MAASPACGSEAYYTWLARRLQDRSPTPCAASMPWCPTAANAIEPAIDPVEKKLFADLLKQI